MTEGQEKDRSANDLYKERMEKSNLQMDQKADEATRAALLDLIENNINRKFFKEARLEAFFQKCFTLTDPQKLMDEKAFYTFVYYDLKQVL